MYRKIRFDGNDAHLCNWLTVCFLVAFTVSHVSPFRLGWFCWSYCFDISTQCYV